MLPRRWLSSSSSYSLLPCQNDGHHGARHLSIHIDRLDLHQIASGGQGDTVRVGPSQVICWMPAERVEPLINRRTSLPPAYTFASTCAPTFRLNEMVYRPPAPRPPLMRTCVRRSSPLIGIVSMRKRYTPPCRLTAKVCELVVRRNRRSPVCRSTSTGFTVRGA